MGDLYDSTHPETIPASAAAVAGYIDGPVSAWPAKAWDDWAHVPELTISVLANPTAVVMDVEDGNAPAAAAVAACAQRLAHGRWSVIYCNKSTLPAVTAALAAARLGWTSANDWPALGVYAWVADPTGQSHLTIPGCPVTPVAVQWAWMGSYDRSLTYPGFPASSAGIVSGQATTDPPGKEEVMTVLHADVIDLVPTPTGKGYWLVASDGGVFAFGDATALDPAPIVGATLARPIVAAAATPSGKGLWLAGGDGGVFCLGDAGQFGSLPGEGVGPAPESPVEH